MTLPVSIASIMTFAVVIPVCYMLAGFVTLLP